LHLSLSAIHKLGFGLGWLIYYRSPVAARTQRENLVQIGLCSNTEELNHTIKANIAETGKAILETLAILQWPKQKALQLLYHCNN
jgi:lauroyl/myristoyl acyltransferase